MEDGIIRVDDEKAVMIGFTSDKFYGTSYLWKDVNRIIISLIESKIKQRGYFSELLNKIESLGFNVAVPTPLGNMVKILKKKGFRPTFEFEEMAGEEVELWIK